MADGAGAGARRWQDETGPDLRPRVRAHILGKLAEICAPRVGPDRLRKLAATFEEGVFKAAANPMDYMTKISMKLLNLDQSRQQVHKSAEDRWRQMQMAHRMQLDNAVQGGNSLLAASPPRAASSMAGPVRPTSQLSNQHLAGTYAPTTQNNAQHEQSDMMAMLSQFFNSQPATVTTVAPSVQSGQQIMQSPLSIQNQNQRPAVLLRPTSSAGSFQASVAQLQGRPVARPNEQQNHLLGRNASGICDVQQQIAHMMMRDHQGLGVNQHHMNSQQFQSVGADVANMNTGYPRGWNNQQSAGSQSPFEACKQEVLQKQANMEPRLITPVKQQSAVSQQSNMHYPSRSPQTSGTMEWTGEVDWREEMFEQIKLWKDAYFPKLMELNKNIVITKIAEEQLQSLPKDKAEAYRRTSFVKNMTGSVLNLLQIQKSEIPETYRGRLPKFQDIIHKLLDCHWKRIGQNQGTSMGHQSQDCHVKPQTIDLTGDTASFTVVPVASPCDSLKSAPSKDSDSVSRFLMHKNEKAAAAVNDCNQATPSKQMTAASPRQAQTAAGQKEDQVRSGIETPVAKKRPIDRLLDEVRSSSPAVLGSSVNSMKSALIALDSVPLPPRRGSSTKLKRSYDLTSSCSEFPLDTLGVSGSTSSGELGAKRQKTQLQNARDVMLDEVEAINRTLINTVICIDDVTDGIASCNGGILIKLSYSAISLVPSLKSHLVTSGVQPLVMPVTLFVPADYPASSPVMVDDGGGDRLRTKLSCISDTVDAAFQRALREVPEPRSLKETASAWDACVRHAATEFACQHGGGTMLGRWESCVGA